MITKVPDKKNTFQLTLYFSQVWMVVWMFFFSSENDKKKNTFCNPVKATFPWC